VILISKYIVRKGCLGITLFPFVFLNSFDLQENAPLVNHKKIHLRQQLELLILPFYCIYIIEFFERLTQYRNWCLAYKNISFEREAYCNEHDMSYLKSRKFW
jgi:hypothetical protein